MGEKKPNLRAEKFASTARSTLLSSSQLAAKYVGFDEAKSIPDSAIAHMRRKRYRDMVDLFTYGKTLNSFTPEEIETIKRDN